MTTTLLLACLLAAGPQSLLVGAATAGTGHGPPPLAADKPAQDGPPAPGDAKPQGQADTPPPATPRESRAKLQAILDLSEATYKKDVAAAMDAYTAVLKREHGRATAAGRGDVAALLDLEIVKSFQERDAAVGGNSAAAYQLEALKDQRATLGKQLDKAIATEDLKRINELDAEIKRADARIEEVSREAAAPAAGAADAKPPAVAEQVRRQLENTLFWIASEGNQYVFCVGKNGKWCNHGNSTDTGTWSVADSGQVTLFSGTGNSRQSVCTLTLSGNRIVASHIYSQGREFRGRILCPLTEAATKGVILQKTMAALGLSTSGSAVGAEIPLAATAARTAASRALESARNARGTAVFMPLKQHIQALVQERQRPGLDGETARQLDKELARVRQISDNLTGSQLMLEEERRELQELRRTALKDRDLELANAADAKIKQLEATLQDSRPAERAANRFTDAVIFLTMIQVNSPDNMSSQPQTYILDADGQCLSLQQGKVGTWKLQSAGVLELTLYGTNHKLQVDRNGVISGKRGTQVILGSVYGPVKDWPGADRSEQ